MAPAASVVSGSEPARIVMPDSMADDFGSLGSVSVADKKNKRDGVLDSGGSKRKWLKVFETPPVQMLNAYGEAKYAKMGFPGACVSYDGVPIPYPKCPAGATGQHKGKEGYPTRRFMVGVDSDGLILSLGNGSHPGTRNDF